MKNTLILLLILLLLGGLYYYSTTTAAASSTIKLADRSFIAQDSEDIGTITIKSKARPLIHLSKKNGSWFINEKHKASQNMVENILWAMEEMEIKYVPTSKENNTIRERIKTFGLDVKTYDNSGKLLNDFIVGPNTNDEYGTYFLNRGAEQAYAMHLRSQEGGIRNFFIHDVQNFRDLSILNLKGDDIINISVDYPKDAANSFAIFRDKGNFSLEDSRGTKISDINQKVAQAFFSSCENVNGEALQNQHEQKDEILKLIPFAKVGITMKDKKEIFISMFPTVDLVSDYNTRSVKDVTVRHQSYFVNTSWGDFYKAQRRFLDRFMLTPDNFKAK